MKKTVLVPLVTLITGLLIGFVGTYWPQENEISKLMKNKSELIQTNKTISEELAQLRLMEDDTDQLRADLSRLLLSSASGGGINSKLMLHPETRELSVVLPEVFSFDQNHAFCRVDTNPEAFIMPTFKLGEMLIEEHEFFMSMAATSMDNFKITKSEDGKNKLVITGELDCLTEVAKTNLKIGSRTVAEIADYRIEAVDAGLGGGSVGDRFEFTVLFDPDDAPVNYSIFGPEFTFTGEMTEGEVTILGAQ